MDKEYYTVAEAAKELGWSKDKIYTGLRLEHIKARPRFTLKGQWQIPTTEITRLKAETAESLPLSAKSVQKLPTYDIDPLFIKAREEHLNEVRSLIERWLEAIPYDPPAVNEIGLWGFNRWGLPYGLNGVTNDYLFKSVREHLPYKDFWEDYSDWETRFEEYIHACVRMEKEIRRKGEAWPNKLELSKDFEQPILDQIFGRQMHAEVDELRFSMYGSRLYAYFLYEDGKRSQERQVVAAEHPEGCIDSYQILSREILESEEVNWLVTAHDEIWRRQDLIRETLQEILIRRDYVTHSCRLCPGTPSES